MDVDGDGIDDIVTARADKPLFGAGKGQLLWLRNPNNASAFPWESRVLADGPDIDVELGPVTAEGQVIFAAEFFGKQLSQFVVAKGKVVSSSGLFLALFAFER